LKRLQFFRRFRELAWRWWESRTNINVDQRFGWPGSFLAGKNNVGAALGAAAIVSSFFWYFVLFCAA
jgi:hypothetical protein